MSTSLAWLVPVAPAEAATVRARVAALDERSPSPLAAVPGVHLGRVCVIGELPMLDGLGDAPVPLLFVAVDSDAPERAVVAALGVELADLWPACEGFPASTGDRFERWLGAHRVRDGFSVRPYPRATVGDVRAGLELRDRLAAFAVRADGLEPAGLRRVFLEAFPEAAA